MDQKHRHSPSQPTTGKLLVTQYPFDLTYQLFGICSIRPFNSPLQYFLFCSEYQQAELSRKHQQSPLPSGFWLALLSEGTVRRSERRKKGVSAVSWVCRGWSSSAVVSYSLSFLEVLTMIPSTFHLRWKGGGTFLSLTSGGFNASPWFLLTPLTSL